MIEVTNLSKVYGEREAIKKISFKINKGDVVGLLGPNGAGKSTTMKIMTGFMAATSGEVKICGYDVFDNPIEVKKRIGYLPETPPLYLDMRVTEYLNYVADLKNVAAQSKAEFVSRAIQKTQLTDVQNRIIRNLSKGFKQRVGIAQAIVSNPDILILDEPTVGLDPKQVTEIRDLINELRGEHTIILSTHILSEVQATCNKVIIIHHGQIVAQGAIEDVIGQVTGQVTGQATGHVTSQQVSSINVVVRTIKPFGAASQLNMKEIQNVIQHGQNHFEVKIENRSELIEVLALKVIESGAGLYQLAPQESSLEDVFIQLTYDKANAPVDIINSQK